MHYAQFQRSQEPPRILPPAQSVAFSSAGGPGEVLDVPAVRERPYDPEVAGELFRVNCSVCHGVNGDGTGPAARHIASPGSYFSTTNGSAYAAPPNLLESRTRLTPDSAYSIVSNGILVMPRFGKLMSEEDIRDVVAYVFDTENGLGTGQ
jgi:mono/diheme cytochrome c family protein